MLYARTEKPRLKCLFFFFCVFFRSKSSLSSQQMKKQRAPRSFCNMTELLPLLHLICKEIPLFSMSGLKHVYTSTAQWQVIIHNIQSFDKANKQKNNMVWRCKAQQHTYVVSQHKLRNDRVAGNIMNPIFNHLEPPCQSFACRHLSATVSHLYFSVRPVCSSQSKTQFCLNRLRPNCQMTQQ